MGSLHLFLPVLVMMAAVGAAADCSFTFLIRNWTAAGASGQVTPSGSVSFTRLYASLIPNLSSSGEAQAARLTYSTKVPLFASLLTTRHTVPVTISTTFAFDFLKQETPPGVTTLLNRQGMGFGFFKSQQVPAVISQGAALGLYSSAGPLLDLTRNILVPPSSYEFVAVEFDGFQQAEYGDQDGNHVGIDINNVISEVQQNAGSYILGPKNNNDTGGLSQKFYAWIDYNGLTDRIDVYLASVIPYRQGRPSKPAVPLLSHVSPRFGDFLFSNADAYVGFTTAEGDDPRFRDVRTVVEDWNFTVCTP